MIRTPDAIRDEIRKARAAGESLKKLAKRFGITPQCACNIAREGFKVPRLERRAKDQMVNQMIIDGLLCGMTYHEIQAAVGVPYDKVYRVAKSRMLLRFIVEFNGRRYLKVGHKIWEMNQTGLRLVHGREFDAVYAEIRSNKRTSLRVRRKPSEMVQ